MARCFPTDHVSESCYFISGIFRNNETRQYMVTSCEDHNRTDEHCEDYQKIASLSLQENSFAALPRQLDFR
jgi:hypothetical protein